jgi:protoporphyrinogen oxidase
MNVAIIGGGITGLTAAYELTKLGHNVTVFEKTDILGGLAQGFTKPNWEWNLEAAYHHLFTSDSTILSLLGELKLSDDILTIRPVTATLYDGKSYQLDSPLSLIQFPGLPFFERIRTGMLIAAMKLNPFWQPLEGKTAKEVFLPFGGKAGWRVIWEPLMVGKFGTYADTIAASWLWARIKKRTPSLVYIRGGFATFINRLVETINKQGGKIQTQMTITSIQQNNVTGRFEILIGKKKEIFNKVLLTVPTFIATQMIPELKQEYAKALTIPHLYAQVLILETKEPVLPDVYWLNITDRSFPFLAVVNHTHFVDRKHYGGNYITYIGNYLPDNHPFLKLTKDQLLKKFTPYLKKLNPSFDFRPASPAGGLSTSDLYVAPFAQPVHETNYSKRAPKMKTSISGLFLANMDSIYPWDRGVNYAVELGQTAVGKILTDKTE